MSLTPYFGEMLISPAPLQLALNYCSHSCPYCFANLNNPKRRTDVTQTQNLLRDFESRTTLVARLLQERYPVLLSNLVDPFAASNYKQTLPFLEQLSALGIPVAFQTRGGLGIPEALQIAQKSVWYISIPYWDDAVRARVEPAAPSVQSRLDLIEKLHSMGHETVVAINPYVSEWLPNPLPLLEALQKLGVKRVLIEPLHLNRDQVATMPKKSAEQLGIDIIKKGVDYTYKKQVRIQARQSVEMLREIVIQMGFITRSRDSAQQNSFYDVYKEVYPKTFPVYQDFINYALTDPDRVFTFDDFWAAMNANTPFPDGVFSGMGSYLGSGNKSIFKVIKVPSKMSYKQLFMLIWSEPRISKNPAFLNNFAMGAEWDGDGWIKLTDQEGMPFLFFDKDGFDDFYTESEGG